ncbi:hypothetical protein LE191_06020 [Janthinobacterium sp. HSC-3S05]|uniref:hypothetical protein n=1 Tax=Janthinobacterium lividum TaxID=29581 RepID=UPI001CD9159F|nr:hypothetical protein [Janthinobacterium lividum]MCA1859663.1 hypothetical protein [Janthinobacterium lividum]
MNPKLTKHFEGLWTRAQQLSSLAELTPEKLRSWAEQRRLTVESVEELFVGAFSPTRCLVLKVSEGSACFPLVPSSGDSDWHLRREWADRHAALWEKLEWFSPFWLPQGNVNTILRDASLGDKKQAIALFEFHTSTLYNLAFQAVCIAQIFPQSQCLRSFEPLAREAYLAFYSGYRAASIASLIPAIEGAINRIVGDEHFDMQTPHKINRAVERAIDRAIEWHYEGKWAPPEYLTTDYLFGMDECVYCLETFRLWLRKSFFRNSVEYDGVTWLNRHLFAHAGSPDWQQSSNFVRLIVALATLGVVDSWHHGRNEVSVLFPTMNDDSKLLHQQAIIRAKIQSVALRLEEKHFHENGRQMPPLPTDDGVILRSAILSDDCINDLVRPLREAGWGVDVGKPDDKALYVSVTATDENERFQVSLLYSCATDNTIYRMLAESVTAILYRGAPYEQRSFARGISVHVGPVTAWRPPLAPSRIVHLRELEIAKASVSQNSETLFNKS